MQALYIKKNTILLGVFIILFNNLNVAGPPFLTDDPQTVDYKHWEYYISSINTFQPNAWTGTCPHIEVNYGIYPNVQVHLLSPLNYDYTRHKNTQFGYAYTEVGVKYRIVQESENTPQIGVFPIIEIPTIKNNEFSNGKTQIYLPLWIQKSWGKLTSYGGAGYWINPGKNQKDYIFAGWDLQYDISPIITLGGELYYHSADAVDSKSVSGFNIGGSVNASSKTHFIFSLGQSLTKETFISAYVGLLWTI